MGGSGSRQRKLTIENDNPMSVIKCSEDVVQRMKGHEVVRSPGSDVQYASPGAAPFLYEPSLTSIQLRQANVQALKDNDAYWDTRIESLQKKHQQMQLIMEEEFTKALAEVKGKKTPESSSTKTVPCKEKRKEIIACYKKYKNEPMRCAKEVQQFAECVDQRRAALIANKC